MAVTREASTTNAVGSGTNATIALPGTPQENDIVVVARVCDAALDAAVIITSGYDEIAQNPSNSNPGRSVAWKRMGASPDANVEITAEGTFAQSVIIGLFRGVDVTTAIDMTPTHASGATGTPDPASAATATNGARRIVIGFLDDDSVTATAEPSGYTGLLTSNNTGRSLMWAEKDEATAGADDPGTWTTAGTDEWYAIHFALRPAGGGGGAINVGVDPASEAETAVAIGHVKTRTVGLASETETAQAITHSKVRTIGVASETETAIAVGHSKSRAIGPALETETAVRLLIPQLVAIGAAVETETAGAIVASTEGVEPPAEEPSTPAPAVFTGGVGGRRELSDREREELLKRVRKSLGLGKDPEPPAPPTPAAPAPAVDVTRAARIRALALETDDEEVLVLMAAA